MSDLPPSDPPPPPPSADPVEDALRRAQEEVRRANYFNALGVLQQALRAVGDDPRLREMLEQTKTAALRHESAVERNQAAAMAADKIQALLARGDLDQAADELHEAGLKFGRHNTLLGLQQRLEELRREAELEKTVAWADLGRTFLERQDWRGALEQSQRILRLDPENEDALKLERRARSEIEREEARRHREAAIDEVRQDVERLMGAGELTRATTSLKAAIDEMGRHQVFDQLSRSLDETKAGAQAKKRLEWTERRLNEAEDLVRQANRLTLQGKYDEAIERLRTARELNPEHPEIADLEQAAQRARERQQAERRRTQELESSRNDVRRLLDELHLDAAEVRLRAAEAKFGTDHQVFRALRTRLERLRQAEREAASPPDVADDATAILRQRELSAAYSWKQTLFYPLRGGGFTAFWVLWLVAVTCEAAAGLPWVGGVFLVLRGLLPLVVVGGFPAVVRSTLAGQNVLPPWRELFDVRRYGRDLAVAAGAAVVAILPLLALVFTRELHGLLAASWGWWLAAVLAWLAAALVVLAWGVAGGWGTTRLLAVGRHVNALKAAGPDVLLAVNLLFAAGVTVAVLRATFEPFVPWLGGPLAAALEVYTLVVLPHLVGVVLRRHRIELSRIYG